MSEPVLNRKSGILAEISVLLGEMEEDEMLTTQEKKVQMKVCNRMDEETLIKHLLKLTKRWEEEQEKCDELDEVISRVNRLISEKKE